jgi:hypothetical protein
VGNLEKMKPLIHARNSVRRWGGTPEDYQPIHDFIDSSKATFSDVRHRAILHSAFGCFLVERVFGTAIRLSNGREISTRDIAEQHVVEDMGFIPRVDHWLQHIPTQDWMMGTARKRGKPRFIPID